MGDSATVTAPQDAPFPLTDTDRWLLSITDEEFHCHDFSDLKKIIDENNLSVLKRKPSDLRRYMKWTADTKAEYGSMTNFLMTERLPKAWGSPPFKPASSIPFQDPSDFRVLINDWPYGLTPDLTHIVVWSRTIIETDPKTGDMTPQSRQVVENFVRTFFAERLGPDGGKRVLWFKNWVALQSVRTLEHIHVLVKDAEKDVLEDWTRELDCHRLPN
ncbi:hypothetical protein F4780DRAFT_478947 [Xylariomycetidae sp. FL0641]|nr:hypothetical protein F4780DRAFT_478947 [Xylariomycetidae sp. FL0641]